MPKQRRRFDPDEIFQPGTQIPVVDYMARQGPPTTALSVAGMENAGVLSGMRQEREAPARPAGMNGTDGTDGTNGTPAGIPAPGGIPAGMPAAGGSVVDELLRGGRRGAGPAAAVPGMAPVRPTESAAAGPVAPAGGWSGTMRPIRLAPGESLMTMAPPMTGVENDPVLGVRKQEFDKQFVEFMKEPYWQSRAEYEQGVMRLPGAGAEIMGHIQQRAAAGMPAGMREEFAQEQAVRTAGIQDAAAAARQDAQLKRYLETATPEQKAEFDQNYQLGPDGKYRPIKMSPAEKVAAQNAEIEAEAEAIYPTLGPDEGLYDVGSDIGGKRRIQRINKAAAEMLERQGMAWPWRPPGAASQAPAGAPPAEPALTWWQRNNPWRGPAPVPGGVPGTNETYGTQAPGAAAGMREGRTGTLNGQRVIVRNGRLELMR